MTYSFPIATHFQITWNCNSLTHSHRAACQRHERSFTHNNNPSKSALIGLWVITVLLLECFVFRFACSVSKANNHSLFTVWVGVFFPSAGQITHKSDSSQRKRGPTASLGSGKCSLKSRGQERWLQPCSLLTLWQGQQRVEDMDILYSYSAHYNKLPSIAAIKSAYYTILRYFSETSYRKNSAVYPLQELLVQAQRRLS